MRLVLLCFLFLCGAAIPASAQQLREFANSIGTYPETVNGVSFKMIAIAGGSFSMGSNDYDDEKPRHTALVSNFYAGETEVRQALWRAVMGTDPSDIKNCDQCPVVMISWDDAQAFSQKLNQRTGKTYRLPSEAEWEHAAGGGSGI
jgi:formylglycine-generating enzyme required for sulfatase activity